MQGAIDFTSLCGCCTLLRNGMWTLGDFRYTYWC